MMSSGQCFLEDFVLELEELRNIGLVRCQRHKESFKYEENKKFNFLNNLFCMKVSNSDRSHLSP